VIPDINANFEINHGLLNLITGISFHGFDHEDPYAHIRNFTDIAETIRMNQVPHDVVKLKLFPFSLKGAARTWLEKEPPNSIHTWNDLASKFVNYFYPPSKTSNLRSQIFRFQQAFDESFSEAWDRFKDLKEKCPNHGFTDLQQIDTFNNGLCHIDQDSLNSAAGGNLLARNTNDAFMIIENKAHVRMSRNKPLMSNNGKNNDEVISMIVALTKKVDAMSIEKSNHQVNVVSHGCETCGGPHLYYECQATGAFSQENVYAANMGNIHRKEIEIFSATVPLIFLDHPVSNNQTKSIRIIMCRIVIIKEIKIRVELITVFKIIIKDLIRTGVFKVITIKARLKGIFKTKETMETPGIFRTLIMEIKIMVISKTVGKISIIIKIKV
jgi:hypothetical protein